jgi:hypothetical protein
MKDKIKEKIIQKVWKLPEDKKPMIRKIYCGKPNCTKCPHGYYLYVRIKTMNGNIDKYVGKCDKNGLPR